MPSITAKYLGTVNPNMDSTKSVVEKNIIRVKASELSQWFLYNREKKGGRHPFKLSESSTIQIHERVQRGKNESGFVLQEKNKVDEIRDTLLGIHKTDKKVYLGSLVWNIRKKERNIIKKIKVSENDSQPPEYELRMDVDNIYLTDSAHRHFGIVEAYNEYRKKPEDYPSFDENFEFSVEIYNLSIDEEQNLFNELNSKQKKITAAKQKELDNSTPLGKIKDEIIDYDMENERIFYNNIELNSNQNNRHTLMTMSVFVASIKEMFKQEIDEVYINSDVNDELKYEIVSYYCDFFSMLRDTIKIKYLSYGIEKEIYPFENLYTKYIYVQENADFDDDESYESKLEEAREKAKFVNSEIRSQDLITHNITIKALSRLGKFIRKMSNWGTVIEQIQQSLIVANDGKFLQKTNEEILKVYPGNKEAIATINLDGSLNMQVVSWKVDDLFNYLVDKLSLRKEGKLYFNQNDFRESLDNTSFIKVSLSHNTKVKFRYDFFIADKLFDEIPSSDLVINIIALDNWSKIKFIGKNSIKSRKKDYDEGYVDEVYDKGIKKASAIFEIDLPPFENNDHLKEGLKVKIKVPNISIGSEVEFMLKTILE